MKKIKFFLSVIVFVLVMADYSLVQAAEIDKEVIAGELVIRELSQTEEELNDELFMEMIGGESASLMATTASYTAYEYAQAFEFRLNGRWVAQAEAKCIVWHYTDGKVHLYSRTITVERLASFDATRTYGRIVNTDGSLSYTTGDRVCIIDYDDFWEYAIDFRVTPTEASFNCYEV